MTASTPNPARTVLLATRNRGKVRELRDLLAPSGVEVIGLESFPHLEDVEETGTSFEENALLKACTVSRATGLVALADDSGLEVDALGMEPGVYSARYSQTPDLPATDERNTAKVLNALSAVPDKERGARFRCCMAACAPSGASLTAQGVWEGMIGREKKGANGFGYDPIFFDPAMGCNAAQMSPEEKNARSHRGLAVKALLEQWPAFWQAWLDNIQ